MTTLIEQLRNDALAARKAAIKKEAGGEHAALLASVASDATMIGKNDRAAPGREPTDDETAKVVKKYIAGLETSIEAARSEEERSRFIVEKRRLEGFLPQMLDGGHLTDAIHVTLAKLGVDRDVKSTKAVVADLQETYPGQIDPAAVSRYLRNV
ncbi:tRNA amidotransferase [Caulobacter phage CcrRogue]|uniref:Putative tRNA amidotransferase domain protein n=1 Tax=Caulobacter phage CcrRogue TaxID=2927986 RepID=K4JQR3_9CAUD|nr:tRNA amidotransferase [Caulobacter phage CcrRogue]AFU86630.1 putative tRNA amidotransferase domain protein [Caulobacter phage CcrRogue]